MGKQLLVPLSVLVLLIVATTLVVLYGKGYRFGIQSGKPEISGTGLLVAKSQPDGAQVFLNNELASATNSTINLSPGVYDVKIIKDGYFPWQKTIGIQKEAVSIANALLFPTAPKLESITDSGIENPVIDPSGTKIAFTVSTQSPEKNGVYVIDLTLRPILTLQSSQTQIANDLLGLFSKSALSWSPDGKQLLATISANLEFSTTYLLEINELNLNPTDVASILETIFANFEKQRKDKETSRIDGLKPALKNLISQNFNIVSWSPDETKILYSASRSAGLALVIQPPLPSANSTPQDREIQKDLTYVYDTKEDKNFKIDSKNPAWFPDSRHLISVNNKQIQMIEYDGTNKTTIYAGPFVDEYVFPWPDGSKIVILTNLGNPNSPPNLYTIGLK